MTYEEAKEQAFNAAKTSNKPFFVCIDLVSQEYFIMDQDSTLLLGLSTIEMVVP
jgi:hypothetical protein